MVSILPRFKKFIILNSNQLIIAQKERFDGVLGVILSSFH